jgi:D-tyrosyl-tRNA(Tyr) deacylase
VNASFYSDILKIWFIFAKSMRIVVQRVRKASVEINNQTAAQIGKGLLVLLGIEPEDTKADVDWLVQKLSQLRIFSDANGLMNLSIQQIDGELLLVSQFTLHARYKKGNRPSFIGAAKPDKAIPLYTYFIEKISLSLGKRIQTGEFGADMNVCLENDGPVTIIMDSKNPE